MQNSQHRTSNTEPANANRSRRQAGSAFRFCAGIFLLLLAAGTHAFGQANGVPAATNYAGFGNFITDRNIFDPGRQPHSYSPTSRRTTTRTRTRAVAVPTITLVGTMSYEKGMFAFFNANNAQMKKALQVAEKIADFTVTDITRNRVKLESADKKQSLELKIGDGLRQENGRWEFAPVGDLSGGARSFETTPASANDGSTEAAPPAPSSATAANDVLRRLMQQREKENQ